MAALDGWPARVLMPGSQECLPPRNLESTFSLAFSQNKSVLPEPMGLACAWAPVTEASSPESLGCCLLSMARPMSRSLESTPLHMLPQPLGRIPGPWAWPTVMSSDATGGTRLPPPGLHFLLRASQCFPWCQPPAGLGCQCWMAMSVVAPRGCSHLVSLESSFGCRKGWNSPVSVGFAGFAVSSSLEWERFDTLPASHLGGRPSSLQLGVLSSGSRGP